MKHNCLRHITQDAALGRIFLYHTASSKPPKFYGGLFYAQPLQTIFIMYEMSAKKTGADPGQPLQMLYFV